MFMRGYRGFDIECYVNDYCADDRLVAITDVGSYPGEGAVASLLGCRVPPRPAIMSSRRGWGAVAAYNIAEAFIPEGLTVPW